MGTIVSFVKRLGIKSVVEFVHSKEVYDSVRAPGANMSRGYYFAEPLERMIKEL